MQLLTQDLWFPPHKEASPEGLLAIGGDLSVARLLLAYRNGIFPWYEEGEPLLWWSPNPRMVLFPEEFKVSKSLRTTIRKNSFNVTFNKAFTAVITQCAKIKREGQGGTWITNTMIESYQKLHTEGIAVSVEVWKESELVGGLYGVNLSEKKVFCGESMFSKVSDASKVGFYYLVSKLKTDNYKIIDCQIYTAHLERLGAREISRQDFLQFLK